MDAEQIAHKLHLWYNPDCKNCSYGERDIKAVKAIIEPEFNELQAELKAKDEAHKNEIFKMNDICVSLCRTKDEAIGLLNGMVLVGIKHSDASRKIVEDALKG